MLPSSDEHRRALDREQERVTAQLADLRRQREQLIAAMTADNADDEHDPEGTTLAWERENLTALITRAEQRSAALTAADARLRDGWTGGCGSCGRAIPTARILARPEAARCVTCAAACGHPGPPIGSHQRVHGPSAGPASSANRREM